MTYSTGGKELRGSGGTSTRSTLLLPPSNLHILQISISSLTDRTLIPKSPTRGRRSLDILNMADLMEETSAASSLRLYGKKLVIVSAPETDSPVRASYLKVSQSLLTLFSIRHPLRDPQQTLEGWNTRIQFYSSQPGNLCLDDGYNTQRNVDEGGD